MSNANMPDTYEFESANRDQAFDPFFEFNPPEAERIAEYFLPWCDEAMPRKRRRKEKDLENYKLVLATVVANAFRASENRPSKLVHYSRKLETYSSNSLYLPSFMGAKILISAIDALASCGFLESNVIPSTKSHFKIRDGQQSSFGATDRLLRTLEELGTRQEHVARNRDSPVIILKDTKKELKNYDPGEPYIKSMIATVSSYNAFLESVGLRLDMTEGELKMMHEEMAGKKEVRRSVNFNDTHLRRIFNNSTFDDGGRWYGGWWQLIPSEYRSRILIDGEDTGEFDYSGCFPRMLYHREGYDTAEDDPYSIPEITEAAVTQGLDRETIRGSLKTLFNILINASRDHRIGKVSGLCLPKGFKQPNRVYPLIERMHQPIARWFRSGVGLQLMRKESDICETILSEGVDKSILVLPIHDSFVVQSRHLEWLNDAMVSHYRAEFGFDPIIKGKKKEEGHNIIDNQLENLQLLEPSSKFSSLEETIRETFEVELCDINDLLGLTEFDNDRRPDHSGRVVRGSELFQAVMDQFKN